jgi:hypothetical protein
MTRGRVAAARLDDLSFIIKVNDVRSSQQASVSGWACPLKPGAARQNPATSGSSIEAFIKAATAVC